MLTAFTRLFKTESPSDRSFTWGDLVALIVVALLIFGGVLLAFRAPQVVQGQYFTDLAALPWYTPVRQPVAATFFSSVRPGYGRMAAYNQRAER
jgi:hypothetical protein